MSSSQLAERDDDYFEQMVTDEYDNRQMIIDGGSSYQSQSDFIKENGRGNERGDGDHRGRERGGGSNERGGDGSSYSNHNNRQQGNGCDNGSGVYDENYFPSPTHSQQHHKGWHNRQQMDKLVDQEFFNAFSDDCDDEDFN